jgi:antitoxin YefM
MVRRRSGDAVAIIAADELEALMETARLPRSPRNAERLLNALARAREGLSDPQSVAALAQAVGMED